MAQSWNDHADDRDVDIRTRLIEHKEIKILALGEIDTSHHLLAFVETTKLRTEVRLHLRAPARRQVGVIVQIKAIDILLRRQPRVASSHESDGQKLVHLGQRTQQRNACIEMRAGTVLDKIMTVFYRVRQRDKARNPEITGDVEDPQPASGFSKLDFEISDVGVVELV